MNGSIAEQTRIVAEVATVERGGRVGVSGDRQPPARHPPSPVHFAEGFHRRTCLVSTEKTVFILGAGFSAPAGGPKQESLLKLALALPETKPKIRKAKDALRDFLVKVLNVARSSVDEISLEDIYTPIDRCLADGVSLRNNTPAELQVIRGQMEYLLSLAIDRAFGSKPHDAKEYVRDFASYLVMKASVRATKARGTEDASTAKAYDPFSVISLNWDIVLDKCLYQALGEHDHWETGGYKPIGVVDYCCYISSIGSREERIRAGLWTLGARGYNVKLLKIHGSMNWLQCSNCQRLFVSFDGKINIPNFINAETCHHCRRYDIEAKLQGSLIMPTFLKDLSNFQIKLVWQNAGVELMEAQRLIFIGYSLPHADFEFRQLLSRMVHKKAKVDVVLYDDGTPEGTRRYEDECKRYRQFFSGRTISFEPRGVIEFVKKLPVAASG